MSKTSGATADAPRVPEAAHQHTKAGAESFAKYFYSRVNILYRQPQMKAIDRLYRASCTACKGFDSDALEMKRNGQKFIDDQLKYRVLSAMEVPGANFHVKIQLTQNPARMVDASGKVVAKTPTSTSNSFVLLEWRKEKGWIVQDLQSA